MSSVRYNLTGFIAAAPITAAKRYRVPVASKIAVTAENGAPIVGIGNDQDVGFVISRACLQPCLIFVRIIGSSHVGVPNRASDLEAAEFVDQDAAEHTRNPRGPVHR